MNVFGIDILVAIFYFSHSTNEVNGLFYAEIYLRVCVSFLCDCGCWWVSARTIASNIFQWNSIKTKQALDGTTQFRNNSALVNVSIVIFVRSSAWVVDYVSPLRQRLCRQPNECLTNTEICLCVLVFFLFISFHSLFAFFSSLMNCGNIANDSITMQSIKCGCFILMCFGIFTVHPNANSSSNEQ